MAQHVHLIIPTGTQVVTRSELRSASRMLLHPAGAVGVIIEAPLDGTHAYRVRFADGTEGAFGRQQLSLLKQFKGEGIGMENPHEIDYYQFVIYRCVVGSRAYGLEGAESDTDLRGFICRRRNSIGRCMECRSNWRIRRMRRLIGSCRSSWCWR